MTEEEELKLRVRLTVSQLMIANLYKILFQLTGTTPEMAAQIHEQFRAQLKNLTFSELGIDAVESDLIAAEFESAFDYQLGLITVVMEVDRK
jgi:hypothetical protein